jgi:sn-1 stearoyl-lipid 9-desaturase
LARRDATLLVLAGIHVAALLVVLPAFFSWAAVGLACGLYTVTSTAVTLAYHRLLAHRSFAVAKPLEYALVTLGVFALQDGPIEWVAQHRAHHAHADRTGDPHDPGRGITWAHAEWLYRENRDRIPPELRVRWVPELVRDPYYRFLDRYHGAYTIALGIALFAAGGWNFVIWGIFARLVFTYHCTWLVSSASHTIGHRTFATNDRSTNNWWVAALTFGEGWHNNHHAFPFSARHGLQWFEFDPTYWLIALMARLRIARDVKLPARETIARIRPSKARAA